MPYLSTSQKNERLASRPIYLLSISPKNGRLTFFAPPPHAFVGFLKDEKWHVGPGFTPVSGKSSRGNGPQMASSGISSHFLQPIYLSLQKTSASPLSPSIYLSKPRAPLKLGPYLRKKNTTLGSAFISSDRLRSTPACALCFLPWSAAGPRAGKVD